jgi:hypothetical protein
MSIDQLQESLKTIGDELKDAEERSSLRGQGISSHYAAIIVYNIQMSL